MFNFIIIFHLQLKVHPVGHHKNFSQRKVLHISQQSSQDWLELNKSPRETLNEALHDLSSKEFVPIALQVSSPWEDLGKSFKILLHPES